MDVGLARTDPIGDRQGPSPGFRYDLPAQCCQKMLRIRVGQRHGWNARDGTFRVILREASGARDSRLVGRERITGVLAIQHAATLHAVRRSRRPGGIGGITGVSILLRVGIDENPGRTVLGGEFHLTASPQTADSDNHDLASDRHAEALQGLVVLPQPQIDVHQRRGDISVGTVNELGLQNLCLIIGVRISGNRRLVDLRPIALGAEQLDGLLERPGKHDREGLDLRIPTPLLEQGQGLLRHALRIRRTGVVGTGGVLLDVGADIFGRDFRLKLLFEACLGHRRSGRFRSGRRPPGARDHQAHTSRDRNTAHALHRF